jgi:hypothetical protein
MYILDSAYYSFEKQMQFVVYLAGFDDVCVQR